MKHLFEFLSNIQIVLKNIQDEDMRYVYNLMEVELKYNYIHMLINVLVFAKINLLFLHFLNDGGK